MTSDYCKICGNPKAECTCGNDDGWHVRTGPRARRRVAVTLLTPLALLLPASLVTSCAEPERGVVYARWYYPASQRVEMTCSVPRADGTCAAQVPVIRTDPARWSLGLRYRDGDGEVREGRRTVTQLEYERCANDDEYPACASDRR